MMMREILSVMFNFSIGIFLGALFFGGLWWTIRKGVSSSSPALWFFGSFFLRMSIALGGFYFVSSGHWQSLVICLVGFIVARLVITHSRFTQTEAWNAPHA